MLNLATYYPSAETDKPSIYTYEGLYADGVGSEILYSIKSNPIILFL